MPSARPWRFVALVDRLELGILRGDVITHSAGRPIRLHRRSFGNSGLLLLLWDAGALADFDAVIGTDAAILEAMEAADAPLATRSAPRLRLIHGDGP